MLSREQARERVAHAQTERAEWRWALGAVAYILDHAELSVVMVEASKLANLIKAAHARTSHVPEFSHRRILVVGRTRVLHCGKTDSRNGKIQAERVDTSLHGPCSTCPSARVTRACAYMCSCGPASAAALLLVQWLAVPASESRWPEAIV